MEADTPFPTSSHAHTPSASTQPGTGVPVVVAGSEIVAAKIDAYLRGHDRAASTARLALEYSLMLLSLLLVILLAYVAHAYPGSGPALWHFLSDVRAGGLSASSASAAWSKHLPAALTAQSHKSGLVGSSGKAMLAGASSALSFQPSPTTRFPSFLSGLLKDPAAAATASAAAAIKKTGWF